ncbi:MAG: restriction endonuclease subunit S [Sulfurovum sp.]|nr:restriction endonuclease subunit S [Sulfurovum sp.]
MSELYELPEGWEWKKLDELTEVNIGKTPTRSKKEYFLGDKVWLSIRDLKEDYISSSNEGLTDDAIKASNIKIVPKGTLLMSFKLTLGKTAFADCDLYTNEAIASLPIKNDSTLDKYFLKYALGTIDLEKEVDNAVKGKTLNKQKLKNLDIPLPPLQEQKRIVAKLDTLFAKIDQVIALHQQNIDEADALMGSVLNEVFGELEERYGKQTLNDVFLIARGGSPRPIKDYITNNSDGINWIKISDATKGDGKYIESTEQKIRPEGLQKSRLVEEGDFIMSNSMSFGRPYIMKTKGAIHDGWLLMREKIENIDREYFYYLFSSNYMYQQFVNKASGTTVKNLNIDLVKSSYIISPPLDIQQKTVTYLDQLFQKTEKLKQAQQEKMESLKDLKASLLDRAFRGEL